MPGYDSIALIRIAKQLIAKNMNYMQDLGDDAATRHTDAEGGYHAAFFDGVAVGLACSIGMFVDGSLTVEEMKRLIGY